MRLLINAPNIHTGGGRILLDGLIKALDNHQEGVLFIDDRLSVSEESLLNFSVNRIKPTLIGRLKGEWILHNIVRKDDIVLCFGNLPPLFKLKGKVIVFIQNRYLIERRSLQGFSISARVRILIEKLWLYIRKNDVNQFIVQTPAMRRAMDQRLGISPIIMPFVKNPTGYQRSMDYNAKAEQYDYDFIYVSSGDPHKNHHRLIDAWIALAEEDFRPILCLTIDEKKYSSLCNWIEQKKHTCDLRIINKGELPHKTLLKHYHCVRALIYPSLFETIGLPLIEARRARLPIIAAELDYVRDIVDPEETFNPHSALSIARAVKRFLGINQSPLPLVDSKTFLKKIFGEII